MMQNHIESYLGLLQIRLHVARRNSWIIGSLIIISIVLFFFIGLTGSFQLRDIIVFVAIMGSFGLSFVLSLSRAEALKAVEDLVKVLQQEELAT
ncbi:MAG: hypothetical protein WBB65_14675 [Anaerolineales bacterium]